MTTDTFKDIEKLESDLWEAADNLRANSKLTSSDYFMPVLGVIFLRHAANRFDAAHRQIQADQARGKMPKRRVRPEDYIARRSLYLPQTARYGWIMQQAAVSGSDLPRLVTEAMTAIEAEFEPLVGVLPKDYGIFEPKVLEDLMRLFNSEEIKQATGDVFGRIYEYFLAKFSIQKAHDNGEFFTPSSIVQTIVNVIEPDHGTVFNGLRPSRQILHQAMEGIDSCFESAYIVTYSESGRYNPWLFSPGPAGDKGAEVMPENRRASMKRLIGEGSWVDHDGTLLNRLAEDSKYQRLASEAAHFGRTRGAAVERMLGRRSSPILNHFGGALCLRGSHARRDGTKNSDIDILYIADKASFKAGRDLLDNLAPHFEQRASIQCYHTSLTRIEANRLVVWLSLRHMRFLGGDPHVYRRLAGRFRQTLRTHQLRDLLQLYRLDPLRQGLSPNHLGSTTNGFGGIVDYEFAMLLAVWRHLQKKKPTGTQEYLLSQIIACYRYLATYKYLRSLSSGLSCWFLSRDSHARLRFTLNSRLCLYISSLS